MRHVITMLFVLAGLIKVTPVIGVLGAEWLQALYQMPFDGLDLLLLMRHRAVLFGVVGGLLLVAAFRPALRALAGTVGLVSVVSYLWCWHCRCRSTAPHCSGSFGPMSSRERP